jgi:hypothetical protein
VRSGLPLLSCDAFHITAAVISIPLSKNTGQLPPLLPSLASLCIYSFPEGLPLPHSLELGNPALFATCFFIFIFFNSAACLLFSLLFSLFFLLWVGGQSVQGAMLIWPMVVYGSTTCCLAHLVICFSQAVRELASGGVRALLVCLFNMEWGCYVWVGGMEESEFCLFLVVFPERCISSISPRFYFRKHAFCFLPLVTILESLYS